MKYFILGIILTITIFMLLLIIVMNYIKQELKVKENSNERRGKMDNNKKW